MLFYKKANTPQKFQYGNKFPVSMEEYEGMNIYDKYSQFSLDQIASMNAESRRLSGIRNREGAAQANTQPTAAPTATPIATAVRTQPSGSEFPINMAEYDRMGFLDKYSQFSLDQIGKMNAESRRLSGIRRNSAAATGGQPSPGRENPTQSGFETGVPELPTSAYGDAPTGVSTTPSAPGAVSPQPGEGSAPTIEDPEETKLAIIEEEKVIAANDAAQKSQQAEAEKVMRIQRINGQEQVDGIMGPDTINTMKRVKSRQEAINAYMEKNGDGSFIPLEVDGLNGTKTQDGFKQVSSMQAQDLLAVANEGTGVLDIGDSVTNKPAELSGTNKELQRKVRMSNRDKLRTSNSLRREDTKNGSRAEKKETRQANKADRKEYRQTNSEMRKSLREVKRENKNDK